MLSQKGSMRKIVIIANPASSRGANAKRRSELISELDRIAIPVGFEYDIVETTARGEAVRSGESLPGSGSSLARRAAQEGAEIVAAAGGDGTVGEVANGLVGTESILGVIPMGTGNDFSRTIGVGTDLRKAVSTLVTGEPKRIDLGKTCGGYFINIAGCGFDAVVADRVNHGFRYLHGTMAYLASVVQTLMSYRPADVEIEIDGLIVREKIMLCAVANARSYGGGMLVAPNAVLSDGMFDVVVVGDVSALEFLKTFPKVFNRTHLSHPKVSVRRGRQVLIRSSKNLPVLADGEDIGNVPASFDICPDAIRVLVPRTSPD